MKVFKIISKTLRLISRSRTSVATVLLGPLLIIVLVGLAFGNINQYSLNIGVYAEEYDDLVESYLEKLQDDSTFKVMKYPLPDLCVNDIKKGSTHTCIEFPKDFELGKEGANQIKFYVDQSKSDILAIVRTVVINQLSERTSEIASEQTEDVLSKVEDVDQIINEQLVVLEEVSDFTSSTRRRIDDALASLESLDTDLESSADDMEDLEELAGDLFDSTDDIQEDAIDAIDYALNNMTGDDNLEEWEESIIDTFNTSETIHHDLKRAVANYVSENNDLDSYTNVIEDDLLSAKENAADAIEALTGVRQRFAVATGNLEGLDISDAENLTAPIKTSVEPVVAEQAPLSYMFPTLLVMVIMLVSTMLAGTLVVMEKTSSSFFRNFVTPTADIVFITGVFVSNLLVTLAQSLLILLVSTFVFGGAVLSNFVTIFVGLVVVASFFTLVGMVLGYLFSTQEIVSLAGISIGSLFILLSGILVPLEQMPDYMIRLSQYNPLLLGESILRKAIVFQTDLLNEVVMRDVFLLLAFALVVLFLVIIVQKIKKEIFLSGANLLKKKRFVYEEDKEEKLSGEKKTKGLEFLEDFTGMESNKKRKGLFARLSEKIPKISKKEDEIVYSGDEEMSAGDSGDPDDASDDDASDDDSGSSKPSPRQQKRSSGGAKKSTSKK
ncbi:MAG: ABC transporter permease, partial [Nanoarchaeota archaeon]